MLTDDVAYTIFCDNSCVTIIFFQKIGINTS